MAKFGKKYQDAAKLVEAGKAYDLAEAIEVVKKTSVLFHHSEENVNDFL